MMKRLVLVLMSLLTLLPAMAQQVRWEKLSPMLRQMVRQQPYTSRSKSPGRSASEVCAFIRLNDPDNVFHDYGCRDLAAIGNIHIASIPIDRLGALSLDKRVLRIEARPTGQLLLDTVARCVNATPIYEGITIPQAYTGRGVVVGLMDIGFDLTHPTFRTADGALRIHRLWDMLSADTIGSAFYVGRDYASHDEMLALGHSRDGLDHSHGTHTAGIAAGNGYDSPYRGLAPESDICLVANAVSDNADLIDSTLLSRFTFATDALGFKYLYDYAREVNQPCVVSFSEGSGQDFWGYDRLYYEMLDKLLGPGRIMVVAAGNQGHLKSWFSKTAGPEPMGFFARYGGKMMMLTLKSSADFRLRLVSYNNTVADTLTLKASDITASPDSLFTMRFESGELSEIDSILVEAYPNCYDSRETCYDVVFFSASERIGTKYPLSLEVLNNKDEVTCWHVNGEWTTNTLNSALDAGEATHNILSPASAPRVICVGATTYRDSIQNYSGEWKSYWKGHQGTRVAFSSVGPTMDGRTKPDVMAPGNNIISAYNSYYLENHPTANDITWDVAHFSYQGRTYAWNSNTGTSMACPVVAGVIALWLQAKPDLTPEEAMAVISRTSRRPDPMLTYPNNYYGYGEINAYRGLLDILGVDRIASVSTKHTPAHITIDNHQLIVSLDPPFNYFPSPVTVSLYSLSGQLMMRSAVSSSLCSYVIPLPESLSAGVYAVQLDGTATISGSTLIRLK